MSKKRRKKSKKRDGSHRTGRKKSKPPNKAEHFPVRRFLLFFFLGSITAFIVTFAQRPGTAPHQQQKEPHVSEKQQSVTAERSTAIHPYLKRGSEALITERYSEAYRQFTRACALAPNDPRPYRGLGDVYRMLDRNKNAEQAYRRALELDPAYASAKIRLAHVLYRLGDNREALAIVEEARKKNPDDPILWVALANNAMRLGKPEDAIPWIEKFNKRQGKQVWGYALLGRAFTEKGDTQAAEKVFRQAIEIDPKTAQAYLWLGQLLVATGRRREADRALAHFRENKTLRVRMRRLQRSLLAEPNDVTTLCRLARARIDLGRIQDAVVPLRRALELSPNNPEARALYSLMQRMLEKGSP